MKIATWNVNSIRTRLPNVLRWLDAHKPDVLLLQELKCEDGQFPATDFETRGYKCAVAGQKAWNGVAILSKFPIKDILRGLPGNEDDPQSRYIEATIEGFRVASIYAPNGNPVDSEKYPYKLQWLDRLRNHAQNLLLTEMPLVLGGDYNVIPAPEDCYSPESWAEDALFRIETRKKFRTLLNLGLTDALRALHSQPHMYTFWDYQAGAWQRDNGIRIDHFLLSAQAAARLESCAIDKTARGEEKASDHTPVVIKLS